MDLSTRITRRTWARLERRARRGHERDLMRSLRELTTQASPVLGIDLPGSGLDAIRIDLVDSQIVLAGAAPRAIEVATELARARATLALVDVGRYQRKWWLTVSDGIERRHVASAYLRMVPRDGRRAAVTAGVAPDGVGAAR